eukprot:g2119.t1
MSIQDTNGAIVVRRKKNLQDADANRQVESEINNPLLTLLPKSKTRTNADSTAHRFKLISGLQNGVERGAMLGIDRARMRGVDTSSRDVKGGGAIGGVSTGGYMPLGFKCDDFIKDSVVDTSDEAKESIRKEGKWVDEPMCEQMPRYIEHFGVRELPSKAHKLSLKDKDLRNVEDADILIAFRADVPNSGAGTEQTLNYALFGEYVFLEQFENDKKAGGALLRDGMITNPGDSVQWREEQCRQRIPSLGSGDEARCPRLEFRRGKEYCVWKTFTHTTPKDEAKSAEKGRDCFKMQPVTAAQLQGSGEEAGCEWVMQKARRSAVSFLLKQFDSDSSGAESHDAELVHQLVTFVQDIEKEWRCKLLTIMVTGPTEKVQPGVEERTARIFERAFGALLDAPRLEKAKSVRTISGISESRTFELGTGRSSALIHDGEGSAEDESEKQDAPFVNASFHQYNYAVAADKNAPPWQRVKRISYSALLIAFQVFVAVAFVRDALMVPCHDHVECTKGMEFCWKSNSALKGRCISCKDPGKPKNSATNAQCGTDPDKWQSDTARAQDEASVMSIFDFAALLFAAIMLARQFAEEVRDIKRCDLLFAAWNTQNAPLKLGRGIQNWCATWCAIASLATISAVRQFAIIPSLAYCVVAFTMKSLDAKQICLDVIALTFVLKANTLNFVSDKITAHFDNIKKDKCSVLQRYNLATIDRYNDFLYRWGMACAMVLPVIFLWAFPGEDADSDQWIQIAHANAHWNIHYFSAYLVGIVALVNEARAWPYEAHNVNDGGISDGGNTRKQPRSQQHFSASATMFRAFMLIFGYFMLEHLEYQLEVSETSQAGTTLVEGFIPINALVWFFAFLLVPQFRQWSITAGFVCLSAYLFQPDWWLDATAHKEKYWWLVAIVHFNACFAVPFCVLIGAPKAPNAISAAVCSLVGVLLAELLVASTHIPAFDIFAGRGIDMLAGWFYFVFAFIMYKIKEKVKKSKISEVVETAEAACLAGCVAYSGWEDGAMRVMYHTNGTVPFPLMCFPEMDAKWTWTPDPLEFYGSVVLTSYLVTVPLLLLGLAFTPPPLWSKLRHNVYAQFKLLCMDKC